MDFELLEKSLRSSEKICFRNIEEIKEYGPAIFLFAFLKSLEILFKDEPHEIAKHVQEGIRALSHYANGLINE